MTKKKEKSKTEKAFDLWAPDVEAPKDTGSLRKTRKRNKLARTAFSDVSAVEAPPPGSSINPTYDDHQNLLGEAYVREIRESEEAELLKNALSPPKSETDNSENTGYKSDSDSEFGSEEEEEGSGGSKVAAVDKGRLRKTRTELNRRRRLKDELVELKRKQVDKRKVRDIHRIREIERELAEEEAERHNKKAEREIELLDKHITGPRRLGKMKFVPQKEPILLTEELEQTGGSLRKLPSLSNSLFEERVKSLQKRNVVEVTSQVRRKDANRKRKWKLKTKMR